MLFKIALSIIVTFLTTVRSLALPWWYVSVRSAICICQEGKAGKFHRQLHQHFRRFQMKSRHYKTNKCFGYTKLNYSIHCYSNASNTGSLCLKYYHTLYVNVFWSTKQNFIFTLILSYALNDKSISLLKKKL